MWVDTKTERTLAVSFEYGPPGTAHAPLVVGEYVAWLDRGDWSGAERYDPQGRLCPECRKPFLPSTAKMEYCSKACRNYASARRGRQAEMEQRNAR